jgi:hypothetical protein
MIRLKLKASMNFAVSRAYNVMLYKIWGHEGFHVVHDLVVTVTNSILRYIW